MSFFRREDWTLFRNLNTLGQKAGVPKEKLAALVLKELADNALDAGASCDVCYAGGGTYIIRDDGPGIPGTDEEIAALFSINRPLSSSKLYRLPTRGALGNGLRVVAGAVLASGGTLQVTTRGRRLTLVPQDDGTTQIAQVATGIRSPETEIRIQFGPALQTQQNATALADQAIAFRGESKFEGLSSPHWYDSDAFYELLQAAGDLRVGAVVSGLVNLEKLRGGALESIEGFLAVRAGDVGRGEADMLLGRLRDLKLAPKPTCLGVVGPAIRYDGYAKKATTFEVKAARGKYHGQIPVVIEVWATKLAKDASPSARILINRTPIGAAVSAWQRKDSGRAEMGINGCGLNHWFKTGRHPLSLTICVTAPYMPITTDGKEPNLFPLLGPLVEAVTAAARKAKAATASERQETKAGLIEEVLEEAIQTASGNHAHRYSLRQLFYACRPLLQARGVEEELSYGYFGSVVTDIEAAAKRDLPGMYRDARGTLYHPHTGESIALGTLNVERYKRPEYRFNKVLYIEKGGFFPTLIDEQWAERHDCALLTSQGFASRAARDVIDLIGDKQKGAIQFFCLHDADGPGTMIVQSLIEATRARAARRVEVINLGLEPWEAKEMGLQSETVTRKKGRVPVADYIKDASPIWTEWLQENRYELNAMSTPVFLDWLDKKMAPYAGKVVPPEPVLTARFEQDTREELRQRLIAQAVRNLGIDQQVEQTLARARSAGLLDNPEGTVVAGLSSTPADPWETPLRSRASTLATELLGSEPNTSRSST